MLVEVEGEQEFIIDRIINSRVSADGGTIILSTGK